MSAPEIVSDAAPPRITALPFVYTAPLALCVAGVLMMLWGSLATSTPWSSLTLSLTHVGTLGFLSMVAVGVFAPLVAIAGGGGLPWPRATHVIYYTLVLGVGGLAWGTARVQPGPVFFAIGSIGLMGVVFLTQGTAAVLRARARGETMRALRVALWSFFLVASLGVWLAHGHGGMQFPGPRPLWLQVHLSVGLLGWLGGVIVALSAEMAPRCVGARAVDPDRLRLMSRAIAAGVTLPAAFLLAQYFGALDASAEWGVVIVSLLGLPALLATWFVHPWMVSRSLAGADRTSDARFLRIGLLLGPVTGLVGTAALVLPLPRLGVLFGWLAIHGWAGTYLYGVLIAVCPQLLAPEAPTAREPGDDRGRRIGLGVHLGTLGIGALAIATGNDVLARLTGLALLADGVVLMGLVVRACGPRVLAGR